MLIFLRNVVVQNNDVILSLRWGIRDHRADHDVKIRWKFIIGRQYDRHACWINRLQNRFRRCLFEQGFRQFSCPDSRLCFQPFIVDAAKAFCQISHHPVFFHTVPGTVYPFFCLKKDVKEPCTVIFIDLFFHDEHVALMGGFGLHIWICCLCKCRIFFL